MGRGAAMNRLPMQRVRSAFNFPASIAFVTALLLLGCNRSDQSTSASSAPEKKAKSSYTIGMSQCNLGEPWRVEMNAQIKAAGACGRICQRGRGFAHH